MYWIDHNPPHFHAKYGEHRAEFEIRTLGILRGQLPPKATALVVEWAAIHQDELQSQWERTRQHEPLVKIEPLQ